MPQILIFEKKISKNDKNNTNFNKIIWGIEKYFFYLHIEKR